MAVAWVGLTLGACTGYGLLPDDGGVLEDAGVSPDGGVADAGPAPDGGGGSPDAGPAPDAGPSRDAGARPDAGSSVDAGPRDAGFYPFPCGTNPACSLTAVCCAAPNGATTTFSCQSPAACPAGDAITCSGPQDCPGALCCGLLTPNGNGSFPNCQAASLGVTCQASCPTQLASNCSTASRVVLCNVGADCTDSNYSNCCTFSQNGASLTFCVDGLTALGGSCH